MIRKKIGKTRYIITISDITGISLSHKYKNKDFPNSIITSDMLFVWNTNNLLSGNETFINIHKEAGSIVRKQCSELLLDYGNEDNLGRHTFPTTKIAITSSGKLNQYYNFLHCVLPNYRTEEKTSIVNLIKLTIQNAFVYLDLYSEKQILVNKVTLSPIPDKLCGNLSFKELKEIMRCLIDKSNKMKEVQIVCSNEEEYELYSNVFLAVTVPFWERWFIKIFKTSY